MTIWQYVIADMPNKSYLTLSDSSKLANHFTMPCFLPDIPWFDSKRMSHHRLMWPMQEQTLRHFRLVGGMDPTNECTRKSSLHNLLTVALL